MARHFGARLPRGALASATLGAILAASALAHVAESVPAEARQRSAGSYAAAIEGWRSEREAELRSAQGWLTVAGLTWLKEGTNVVGRDPTSAVRLDSPTVPLRVGAFEFRGGVATFDPQPGEPVNVNGKPATRQVIRWDSAPPDRVQCGTVTMFIIKRGSRFGVRVRDTDSRARREFSGTRWYPIRAEMAVTARFVRHEKPTTIPIANVLGDIDPWPSPGYAVFTLGGREHRLYPVLEGPSPRQLFFIFRDRTSGTDTYGGGRFLYTEMPVDGKVVLDFNKAENPPCAYTAFATCPLPPKENALPTRIEAGERNVHQ